MWKKRLLLGLVILVLVGLAVGLAVAPAFAQEEAAAKDQMQSQSFLGLVVSSAGVIGFLIIALSIVSVALLFRAIFTLRRDDLMPPEAQQQLDALLREKRIKEAMDYCRQDDSILSKVIGAGLSEIRSGYGDMKEIMTEVGEEESIKLHQSIGHFSLIANVSPMLGLFGTVYGMMLTFRTIASSGGMAKPSEMAYGIMTALVTTFLGLLVAIPNIVFFTFFRNKVVRILLEVGVVAEELMGRFKTMQIQGAPGAAPSGPQLPSQARAATAAPGAQAAQARPAGQPPQPPQTPGT
ncbi:MAG: MotA/TolQ/ExbB proton channel family protein [Planctomycetes bacterium]|nr:MotA/TolQ/ExbB proton channel family protein [Planctomycetota bacterium]